MHMIALVSGANHTIRQRHERKANWTPNYPSADGDELFICIFRLEMLMTRIIYALSLSCGGLDCVWKNFMITFTPRGGRTESRRSSRENCKQINWHSLRHLLSRTDLVESCAAQRRRIARKISRSRESFPSASSEKNSFQDLRSMKKMWKLKITRSGAVFLSLLSVASTKDFCEHTVSYFSVFQLEIFSFR